MPLDNEVLVWGRDHSLPEVMPELTGVSRVVAGGEHALALRDDGTIWALGSNDRGEPVLGDTEGRRGWARVSGLDDVVDIAAHWGSNLAVRADGSVWGWGWNAEGNVVPSGDRLILAPTRVPDIDGVRGVAAGSEPNNGVFSMALKQDGTVWAWGINYNDWWGIGARRGFPYYRPTQIPGLSDVTAIAAGGFHNLALKRDGTLCAPIGEWRLGSSTRWQELMPQFDGVAVSVTDSHCLALRRDGSVWAWSAVYGDPHGWLGTGAEGDHYRPERVIGIENGVAVAAGGDDDGYRSFALRADGTVWAWGANDDGSLGAGDDPMYASPARVRGLDHITGIGAGHTFALALRDH